MRISELMEAKIISLNNEICHIIINKVNHTIIQVRQWNDDMYQDCTEMCEKMEDEYTIGDMVVETPYKTGMIMSKLLNNRIDDKCMSFINLFKVQNYNETKVEIDKRQYENQPDMREKIKEYINELDTEIDRLESDLEKQMTYNVEACKVTATESRLNAIIEVKNDLLGRLEEVI